MLTWAAEAALAAAPNATATTAIAAACHALASLPRGQSRRVRINDISSPPPELGGADPRREVLPIRSWQGVVRSPLPMLTPPGPLRAVARPWMAAIVYGRGSGAAVPRPLRCAPMPI